MIYPKSCAARMLLLTGILATPICGAKVDNAVLERGFTQTVRPFINQYCVGCHRGTTSAAQLDLKSFTTLSAVVQDLSHWTLLMERLEHQEMPPKPMAQPPADRSR